MNSPFRLHVIAIGVAWLCANGCKSDQTSGEQSKTSIEEIEEEPEKFLGKRVSVTGEVGKIYNERAFIVKDDDLLWDEEVLVLTRKPVRFGDERLSSDEDISVSGEVNYLVVPEIGRELGWDLDGELEVSFRDKPVIIADSVTRLEKTARWSEVTEPEGVVVSIITVNAVPIRRSLVGKTAELDAIPVYKRVPGGLWVGYGDDTKLLVRANDVPDGIGSGDLVKVKGTLKNMPPVQEAAERWQLTESELASERGDLYLEAEQVSASEVAGGPFAPVSVRAFSADPMKYTGQWVHVSAQVDEVISDRAFWLKNTQGKRILGVVREDVPSHEMIDIDTGQTIQFVGLALAAEQKDMLAGTLESDAEKAIDSEKAFVTMYWKDVKIDGAKKKVSRRSSASR